ncbi:von Willebrand factor type A domain-containing protein [Micromonospora sp. DR5-3]|uniref:vWA domain-containing protein n=1 Tax=unclassified Micromonospora TaxID=2617518 RepID=UPI0016523CEE|nr:MULTISPECIES: von Willebrand factor type A domain-containing protein [unclassified Micromonospora]MCW3818214.1 von Willebrand factor type A domain-containing protein [Micromonospora sp. DR5-3]
MVHMRRWLPLAALALTMTVTACSAGGGQRSDSAHGPVRQHDGTPRSGGNETATEDDPRSTFGVDVDTASYGYARRLIMDGQLPERTAVRPEEFVNSFRQDYVEPAGDGFAVHVDGARLPDTHETAGEVRLMRVGLQTRVEDEESRPDAALTFVVDVSGSMGEPGRLDLVKDALHTLVDQLRRTDSIAIVEFSDEARVIREMTRVSDADELHDAVDSLRTRDSTNLEAGLVLGYRVARDGFRSGATNRVIVLSDGLANAGRTEAEPILRRVRDEAAKQIALLGVGVGSEYGDELMEQLADKGDGFVVYASERAQARKVFVRQLPATLSVRALDAKVQVSFEPSVVRSYRLIGYDNRAIDDEDFRDDRVDGGEVGPGHSVTALYAVRLADEASPSARVARVQVRWTDPHDRKAAETYGSVTVGDLNRAFGAASPRLRTCYAAAYFAQALQGGPYGREVRLGDLATIAEEAAAASEDAEVKELARVIRLAEELR